MSFQTFSEHNILPIALFQKNPKLSFLRHELKISPTNLKIKVSERSCYTFIRISMFILKAKEKLKQTHGSVVIFASIKQSSWPVPRYFFLNSLNNAKPHLLQEPNNLSIAVNLLAP